MTPVIVPLGGFLGSGKTTLILAAARVLAGRGLRCAAILNDQGRDLTDTRFVTANGVDADEVTGGCFCCRFSDLIAAAQRLRTHAPDVIFAEAVGSCTDISATTLQPLKLYHCGEFRLAPYTVLVDPQRIGEADPDWSFLFRAQIEEADLVCYNKSDLYESDAPGRHISALTGQGVAEWLDEVLAGHMAPGSKTLEIDYERYARAEASLAWLNCRSVLRLDVPLSPAMVVGPLLARLDAALTASGLRIAHLKVDAESDAGFLKASITANGEEPNVQGVLDASPAARHELWLNVRAAGEPEVLRGVVERELGDAETVALDCFRPAPPVPEFRIGATQ
jgi:hypothetical protein